MIVGCFRESSFGKRARICDNKGDKIFKER